MDEGGARAHPHEERVGAGAAHVRHQLRLSPKFEQQFRDFWTLPEAWTLKEEDLGVPSYGSKFRMDLSQMPDVKTVVLVEE